MTKRKDPVNIETCWVDWGEIGYGVRQYTCFKRGFVFPIGLSQVVVTGDPGLGDIGYSFVRPDYRRQGVRTLIHEVMTQHCDALITGAMSKSGEKFLRSVGFKYDKRIGRWIWIKKAT